MGWSAPPAAPKCPCCKVSVYPAEAIMASDRLPMMMMVKKNQVTIFRIAGNLITRSV